jgi:toxin-antitoxin system PIN domain toxin
MNAHLLDVNVLLALFWTSQESHAAAQTWFARSGHRSWATNAVTQLGLLRLLMHPAITGKSVGAREAMELLEKNIAHPGHKFWPLERPIDSGLHPFASKLHGHHQWTGALLLGEAARRGGVLVTFDAGLKQLASGGLADYLLVLKSRA